MKVLITYGGMSEAIDGVRSISNTSSGATGVVIADYFKKRGAEIVVFRGKNSLQCNPNIETHTFVGFDDLDLLFRDVLPSVSFDAVIHLAAVSDYKVDSISLEGKSFIPGTVDKIDSADEVILHLKKTPKLISRIKELQRELLLVGFKLTNSSDVKVQHNAVMKLQCSCDVDYVVHNDLSQISKEEHHTTIYNKTGEYMKRETKEQLAVELYKIIEEKMS